ncbi:hypothetical protein FACS189472_07010 [Alphaproteobacteria bacterium]|nr:hypothetical protein FACS189472_07010 [Alphaproteobacteria bacterium]
MIMIVGVNFYVFSFFNKSLVFFIFVKMEDYEIKNGLLGCGNYVILKLALILKKKRNKMKDFHNRTIDLLYKEQVKLQDHRINERAYKQFLGKMKEKYQRRKKRTNSNVIKKLFFSQELLGLRFNPVFHEMFR